MFQESASGQVADFMNYTGFELVSVGDHFTFKGLQNALGYSIKSAPINGGAVALSTYQGRIGEVFRQNQVVFDFSQGLVVPRSTVTQVTKVSMAGLVFTVPRGGLILPGSMTDEGRVVDYSGWFSMNRQTWLYSEVGFV